MKLKRLILSLWGNLFCQNVFQKNGSFYFKNVSGFQWLTWNNHKYISKGVCVCINLPILRGTWRTILDINGLQGENRPKICSRRVGWLKNCSRAGDGRWPVRGLKLHSRNPPPPLCSCMTHSVQFKTRLKSIPYVFTQNYKGILISSKFYYRRICKVIKTIYAKPLSVENQH